MERDLESARPDGAVADAYRRFRSADIAMRERVRDRTAMSENELRMIQFLIEAEDAGRDVKPSDLTRHLGVSSASTTALLDRLERAGCLHRVAHPTDRRSILISATESGHDKIAATVGAFDARLLQLSSDLPADARRSILDFLNSLADAADAVASPTPAR